MSTSAKLILDMRRAKKDGTYPIALRITHKRTPLYLVYQYSVMPEHWDAEGCYINPDYALENTKGYSKTLQ